MAAEHIELKLAWDANLEADLDGYEIYYAEGYPCSDDRMALIDDIYLDELLDKDEPKVTITNLYNGVLTDQITPAFTVPSLSDNSTYCIALKAFDTFGNISQFSEKLCVEVSGSSVSECNTSENDDGGGGGGWLITTAAREFRRATEKYALLILFGILILGIAVQGRK